MSGIGVTPHAPSNVVQAGRSTPIASTKKWIAGATGKKGKLHEALHVPKDEKIPAAKLHAAAKKGGKVGKEARLAETLKGLNHKHH